MANEQVLIYQLIYLQSPKMQFVTLFINKPVINCKDNFFFFMFNDQVNILNQK